MKKWGELVPRRLISGKYDHNRWEEGIKRIRALPPSLSFCFSNERERERGGEREEHLSSRKSVLARNKRKRTKIFFASHDSIEAKGRNIGPVKPRKIECTPRKSRIAPSFLCPLLLSQFFNRSFRVFNAKNLWKVSLLESLRSRIRNGPRWVQAQTSIKKLFGTV